jgi:deoxyinosine 3'endonuclease (endonuclease V)
MKQLEGLLPTSQQSDGKPKGPSKLMLENWKLEQEMVASTVQVHDDPPVDISVISHNSLFHVVKGDTISDQPELYGGVDVSFPGREGDKAVAVYVVIDKRNMTCVYKDHLFFDIEVPYVPTFLAFREIRPLEMLVHRQVEMFPHFIPKAILVDG